MEKTQCLQHAYAYAYAYLGSFTLLYNSIFCKGPNARTNCKQRTTNLCEKLKKTLKIYTEGCSGPILLSPLAFAFTFAFEFESVLFVCL